MTDLLDDDGLIDLRPRGRRTDPAAFVADERRRRIAIPEQNEALRGWDAPPTHLPTAPTVNLCATCGKAAKATCAQCGLGMCRADSWTMLGLCKRCVADTMRAPA